MELPHLIDLLDETIYISDLQTYEMVYINKAGLESIGSSISLPYEGQPCYRVLQGRDTPCPFCTNRVLTDDRFYVWEHTNQLIGRHYLLKDKLIPLPDGRKARMEIAIDITEKQNLSENIREQLEIHMALVSCLRYLSPPNTFESGIRQVLRELGEYHRADRAYIIEFNQDAGIAVNTYEWCAGNVTTQKDNLQAVPLKNIQAVMKMLRENGVLFIPDVDGLQKSEPQTYELLQMQDIRSLIATPLYLKDEVVGMLGVDNPRRGRKCEMLESLSFFITSGLKRQRVEDELSHIRRYDALTKLQNYDSYMECQDALRTHPPDSLGVVSADINALKQINHRYGPAYGDVYIEKTARLLERAFPEAKVFRVGGDEFAVLWENAPRSDFLETVTLLEHLLEKEQDFTVSVGSTWAEQRVDVDAMTGYADHLQTLRKQDFYRLHQPLKPRANTLLHDDFLSALQHGQFIPYLQPKADTQTGRLTGAEMLVRRFDPERGIIPPAEFIERLEEDGIIKYLDFYMLQQACGLLQRWNESGAQMICVSVNVSRVTLMEPDFLERLEQIRQAYVFPRHCLELEATERIGNIERETLLRTAAALRHKGFRISLDDFGAEYSSLSLLTALDVDVVKLDKSLIDEIAVSQKSAALAECIVNICHRFGMRCIAEGVETQTQREVLRTIRCDGIQGYLLSKPVPVDEFERMYQDELLIKQERSVPL